MKLKVVAGAKEGHEIPLKKSKFVIGRASDCTLRAGSEAISRHHCVLLRTDAGISIRDLGSRNGTFVNDSVIEGETPLSSGDKIRVGPLEFVFEGVPEPARNKKPKLKDIADAVERAAAQGDSASIEEEDISRWLLGPEPDNRSMKETQSFRMDETRAVQPTVSEEDLASEAEAAEAEGELQEESEDGDKDDKGKKKPGKLPKLPPKPQSKDSCEAAADILRELARRR